MTITPKQVEHTPEVQAFLDKLAELISPVEAEKQVLKNPECALEAGSVHCLNAASDICEKCEWWAGLVEEEEI